MTVPLPTTVRVGPRTYTVTTDEATGWRCQAEIQDRLAGCVDHTQGIIWIDGGACADEQRDTLLHEVLHAVFRLVGLHGDLGGTVTEEQVVGRVTPTLLGVLRDNPALVAALLS